MNKAFQETSKFLEIKKNKSRNSAILFTSEYEKLRRFFKWIIVFKWRRMIVLLE